MILFLRELEYILLQIDIESGLRERIKVKFLSGAIYNSVRKAIQAAQIYIREKRFLENDFEPRPPND